MIPFSTQPHGPRLRRRAGRGASVNALRIGGWSSRRVGRYCVVFIDQLTFRCGGNIALASGVGGAVMVIFAQTRAGSPSGPVNILTAVITGFMFRTSPSIPAGRCWPCSEQNPVGTELRSVYDRHPARHRTRSDAHSTGRSSIIGRVISRSATSGPWATLGGVLSRRSHRPCRTHADGAPPRTPCG